MQVADRVFLGVVAAGIGVEVSSARGWQANVVAGFVQDGVQRRVGTGKELVCFQSGFVVTPVAAGNGCIIGATNQFEVVPR